MKKNKLFSHLTPYAKSIHTKGDTLVYMTEIDGDTCLIISGKNDFEGEQCSFEGVKYTKAGLTHANACLLREMFPFTAPSPVLRQKCTIGVGDRLGIATAGHLKVFNAYDCIPVLAQQSIRELSLTDRDYTNVLDCVTFEVFKQDFTRGYGADGDHLKTFEQIEYALSSGYSMITLDCSDYIKQPENVDVDSVEKANIHLFERYCSAPIIMDSVKFTIDRQQLATTIEEYGSAIEFIVNVYNAYIKNGAVDFEISIDETSVPTTPAQHYFIADQLTRRGVKFDTIAPRFCGEFQKGIDYIGDVKQFEKELLIHNAIAKHFDYKLSIHSGSDKFAVFGIIGKITEGNFHLKTAGTNWLEAVKLIAMVEPALYREVHKYALSMFHKATKYYHVTTNLNNIPNIDTLTDEQLPSLFANNDCRQLIHITYGLILQRTVDGKYVFKEQLYKVWKDNAQLYNQLLFAHIGKHLELLGCKRFDNLD